MSHGSAHLQSQNSPPGLPISRPTSFPYAVKPLPFIRPSPDGEGVLSLGTSYDLIRSNGGKMEFFLDMWFRASRTRVFAPCMQDWGLTSSDLAGHAVLLGSPDGSLCFFSPQSLPQHARPRLATLKTNVNFEIKHAFCLLISSCFECPWIC